MATQVQFISVQDLKDFSPIESNVDEKVLNICIREVQDLELIPAIGKELYDKLCSEIIKTKSISGYTISEEDLLILSYIKPVMIYGTIVNSLSPVHYKISNKGVQKLTELNATLADRTDISELRNSYSAKFDQYKARLKEYLLSDNDVTNDPPKDQDTTFGFTGIFLSDNTFNEEDYYKAKAYKTGYYRRGIY